ncbi:unnamed protein product [Arabidopsis thaliana]|uniref:Uncharacterized protein n=2 Tax=Arabidopsis TaxID=3701 RepID=A0A654F1X7_ARATH|nr:hypothetical protein ISN44_As02g035820 [Arabidopsis suecica]CAA0375964.1 unnamed protein product [Arabidopsis thaliana]VYS55088.1 unnamed protein product [Arabidopsis thaliana]
MEEQRGISSGVVSEPASNSVISGEKRNGNGLDEKDELGSKRVKVPDLASDAKTSSLQSHGNSNSVQQPNLSSEKLSKVSKVLVAPDAEGIRRVVRENDVLSKDIKPSSTVETRTYLPKAKSISTDDNRRVVNSGKQALLENHTVKTDDSKCRVVKNISLLKPRETTESVVSQRGAAEPSVSVPVGDKVSPFQMCSSAEGSLGESDSMRRWREMKRNGFLSGPLGGVAAPTSTVVTTPVEVPAPKQQKNKRRGGESLKKKNDVPKKEQQLVDRFANVTAPSGLLTELNPGIINHVRTKKQVCSIIEALIRSSNDDATTRERHADFNVRDAIREDRALAFKLPSTGVSDNAISITNPEQATSLAVEAATVASQWLEFLQQDLSGRLSAVQDSRNRVQNILTTELPLLASSRESSSNQANSLEMVTTNTSGDASSDKAATETHQKRWTAKFDQINKALYDEQRDLERSLNQVKEMQSRCNHGLRQMEEYSPFSSQSSDSSFGKDGNQETSMAVQAAAASIFSTCSFLLSMMKPPPTGS